ncbi:MAG: ligase [Chloroflexales bacterium]|nr:ligase [Chloroflexales bacterium]
MSTPQEPWRLLPYSEGPAGRELAAAEGMLAGLAAEARPSVRWYGARHPALVIGSGQRPYEVDGAAVAAAGATLHKRASGGTAVLFVSGFLMQDIALPLGHPLHRTDVSESYAWLGEAWAEALGALGVPTELIDVPTARADTQAADQRVRRACFGGRSPYEVLAGGRKLVGFSQIRRRPGALFQVGLYAHWPGAELASMLRLPADERAATAAALAQRVVGLDELLPNVPPPETIIEAFARAMARRHGVTLAQAPWRPDELAAARDTRPRYAPIDPAATLPPQPSS